MMNVFILLENHLTTSHTMSTIINCYECMHICMCITTDEFMEEWKIKIKALYTCIVSGERNSFPPPLSVHSSCLI